ncbi:552_t:CDS:2 [Paraglomus brasilianum]|uniref:552_t:CDS:1 n=1 Tax=Paraglomus brasilianum TaxID=144538 RepID=A0A9N8WRB3_9GLOM|nr:552_t:CDS:2 [Paraglomus brasilianum]
MCGAVIRLQLAPRKRAGECGEGRKTEENVGERKRGENVGESAGESVGKRAGECGEGRKTEENVGERKRGDNDEKSVSPKSLDTKKG